MTTTNSEVSPEILSAVRAAVENADGKRGRVDLFSDDLLRQAAHVRRFALGEFEQLTADLGTKVGRRLANNWRAAVGRLSASEYGRGDGNDGTGPNASPNLAIEVASEHLELFLSTDGTPCALLPTGRAVSLLTKSGFTGWLNGELYARYGKVLKANDNETVRLVHAQKAQISGDVRRVFMRVGAANGKYYIDMGDATGRVIEIRPGKWSILPKSPVMFQRSPRMQPLPEPKRGGSLDRLWEVLNVRPEDRPYIGAWILSAYRVDLPYPVLVLQSGQGTAKSTACEIIRMVVDPSSPNLRAAPSEVDDIYTAAVNNYVVNAENVSYLPPDIQDAMCTISTGGGVNTRKKYSDSEEHAAILHRPILMNGITDFVTRPDLRSRTVLLELPRLEPRSIRPKEEIDALIKEVLPDVFGGLLDLCADALVELPKVKKERGELPRMADFAQIGEAMSRAMDNEPGTFLNDYNGRVEGAHATSIENSLVASELVALIRETPPINGRRKLQSMTMNELYQELNKRRQKEGTTDADWPRTLQKFTAELRRSSSALAVFDIKVENGPRTNRGQTVAVSGPKEITWGARASAQLGKQFWDEHVPGSAAISENRLMSAASRLGYEWEELERQATFAGVRLTQGKTRAWQRAPKH